MKVAMECQTAALPVFVLIKEQARRIRGTRRRRDADLEPAVLRVSRLDRRGPGDDVVRGVHRALHIPATKEMPFILLSR